jgi:hypothetical protein
MRKLRGSELLEKYKNARVFLNIDKEAKYRKDIRIAKTILLPLLCDNDQALFNEYLSPKGVWVYLKSKYSKPSKIAAAIYTRQLHEFI